MITKMSSNLLFFIALLPFAFLLARELRRFRLRSPLKNAPLENASCTAG